MRRQSSSYFLDTEAGRVFILAGISVLICTTLVFPSNDVQAIERLTQVTNGAATPGQETAVFLRMNEAELYAGGNFWLQFNPDWLSITDVQKTTLTTDFLLTKGFPKPGSLSIAMASTEGLPAAQNANIALIKLQVLPQAPADSLLPLTFVDAYWFDENSVRHSYLGDNGLIRSGSVIPTEENLRLETGSDETAAGNQAQIPMTLSLSEGVALVQGTLHFDPSLLSNPIISLMGDLSGWQQSHTISNGRLEFSLTGSANLVGAYRRVLAECAFDVSDGASAGSRISVELEQPSVANVSDFGFYVEPVHGEIVVSNSTVVPTETPTMTPVPTSLGDFNGDGWVDAKDLLEFVSTWHQEGGVR